MLLNKITAHSFMFSIKHHYLTLLFLVFIFGLFSPTAFTANLTPQKQTTFEWMGHGSFKFTTHDGRVILLDPWISTNPSLPDQYRNFGGLERVDLILFTHGHVDHFMAPDLKILVEKFNPEIIASWELQFLIKGIIPNARLLTFELANISGSLDYHGTTISMVEALHSGGAQYDRMEGKNAYSGDAVGYVLEFENGFTAYHAGDTGLMSSMDDILKEFYRPDLAILPIGGVFTMGPKEAAFAVKMIEPKYVIPDHYGSFPALEKDAIQFENYVKKMSPKTKIKILSPGESVQF